MRSHPIAVTAATSPKTIPMDYITGVWALQFVVSGTATYSVTYTGDDVNNPEGLPGIVPTFFAFPAALTAATTSQWFPGFSTVTTAPQPIAAIQVNVTAGAGTVYATILQASGGEGIV